MNKTNLSTLLSLTAIACLILVLPCAGVQISREKQHVMDWLSKPVIGILAEYDALPMISQKGRVPKQEPLVTGASGNGCGHNLMGTAASATAIAVKRAMEKHGIKGTAKLLGANGGSIG